MACLEILVHEKEISLADKAAEVLIIRPRDHVISQGWLKLIHHYPHDLLEKVMRSALEAKGFDALTKSNKVSNRVTSWFVSSRLSEGILRDHEKLTPFQVLDDYLQGNFFDSEDGIFKEAWRLMLIKGSAGSLGRERPTRILEEYKKPENAHYVPTFGQHYLNVLGSKEKWDDRILKLIADKYGTPRAADGEEGIETPFWTKVKLGAKGEFKTWFMLQQIEEFFEGERADFWRQYVVANRVVHVKKILDGDGFMIDFGQFGVVEFKNLGNAAYIYPVGAFKTFWKKADYEKYVGRFKNKYETVRHSSYPGWDGRIIHKGDWRRETSIKIKTLIER
jgi:hypothetical protein